MVDEDEVPRGALAPPPRKSTLLRVDDAETDIPSVAGSQPISISTHPLHATLQTRYMQSFDRTWKKPRASLAESNTSPCEVGHTLNASTSSVGSPHDIERGKTSAQVKQDLDEGPPPTTMWQSSWKAVGTLIHKSGIQTQTSMVQGTTAPAAMGSNSHNGILMAANALQHQVYEATGSGQRDEPLWHTAYQSAQLKLQGELNITISLNEYIQTMCAPGQELLRRELVRKTISILKYKMGKAKLKAQKTTKLVKRQSN